MSIYPFQRREQLLHEIARQADQDLYAGKRKNNPLKRRSKANRLLLELKPRKLEWLEQNKETQTETPHLAMENLTWKNITNNGKYGLD